MRIGYQKRTKAGDKTIHLPVPQGVDYDLWIEDSVTYRIYLNEQIARHPELFPPEISQGYWLMGFVKSSRQQMKTRRIFLKASREAYQIHPDTVMPFMVAKTMEVEKALYLGVQSVSYEGLAYVMGHNPMFWYLPMHVHHLKH